MCKSLFGAVICSFAGPDHRILVRGKEVRFAMSDMFGPSLLGKRGDPLAAQPGPRNPFWTAFEEWVHGGKCVDGDGLCVRVPLPDPFEGFVRVGSSKNWVRPEHLARFKKNPNDPHFIGVDTKGAPHG